MSLFDGAKLAKKSVTLAVFVLFSALAGCQVRPLYEKPAMTSALNSIEISDANSRVEQVVRNQLIFLLNGGGGEAVNPIYHLELHVSASEQSVMTARSPNTWYPGRVTVTANYTLMKAGQKVTSGTRSVTALVDYASQEYANIRATRDAKDRAAKEVAELIRTDIALALRR